MAETQQPALITDAQWHALTTPPKFTETDDGTIWWAIQHGRCFVHRDQGGSPNDGDRTPYCDDCKKEQEQRWAHLS